MKIAAQVLAPGAASGSVQAIAPLSFWGGFDVVSGRVADHSHPAHGTVLSGTVLVMPAGRGSSSSSSVLAEAIRLGTAPCGIILSQPDALIAVGALVAATLYGASCPIVVVSEPDHDRLARAVSVRIEAGGADAWVSIF